MTSYAPTSDSSSDSAERFDAAHAEVASPVLIQEHETATVPPLENTFDSEKSTSGRSSKVFATTFITIFLAELGDKTQVSTLLMSAESHAPWVVFTGAGVALVATSLVGVLVGRWLSGRLSPKTLDTAAGVVMALISLGLFWDLLQG